MIIKDIYDIAKDIKEYEKYILSSNGEEIIRLEIMIKYFDVISDHNEVYKNYWNKIKQHISYIHKNFCSKSVLRRYMKSKMFDYFDIRNKYDLYNNITFFIETEKEHVSEPFCCKLKECEYKKWYLNNKINEYILKNVIYDYYDKFIQINKQEHLSFKDKIVLLVKLFNRKQ